MISTRIKVFSGNPNLFWVTLLGQFVAAVIQIFVLSIPPKLAALWFGEDEVNSIMKYLLWKNAYNKLFFYLNFAK